VEIDPSLYSPIEQGTVLLKAGGLRRGRRKFFIYLFSDQAEEGFS
jgi:hypothetical protein